MLEIEQLSKRYGNYFALKELNLTIGRGELFGFVGPNGAGKTTTMKIISGLLRADSGRVLLDGMDVTRDVKKIKEKIGYMPDFFGVYDNLKVIEYMEFYASIYGIQGKSARRFIYELLELVNLANQAEDYVDTLSRGMKQKLCLCRLLIHDPELLILDEPASGLDPKARYEMKEILKHLNQMGKTILISSHILPELSQMCSTIGIIQKGSMVLKGTVEEILHHMNASNPLMIEVVEGQEKTVSILKGNHLVENIAIKGNSFCVAFRGNKEEEAKLLSSLVQRDVLVLSFHRQEGTLESLFMQITSDVGEGDKIEI